MKKRYIGIDLHRNRFTCCIRLENERTYVTKPAGGFPFRSASTWPPSCLAWPRSASTACTSSRLQHAFGSSRQPAIGLTLTTLRQLVTALERI